MRFQFFCFLTLALSAIFYVQSSASAQNMKYTTLSSKDAGLKPKKIPLKSLNFKQEEEERQEIETKSKAEKDAMDAVWDRYRELAQGKKNKREDRKKKKAHKAIQNAKPASPAQPRKVSASERGQAEKPAGGFNILDHYEQVQSQRSQMKMITIKSEQDKQNKDTHDLAEKTE